MPSIAIMALLLLLAPTHTEGPVYLLPVNRRVRRQYTPPLRHRHGYARGPNPHSYRIWQPGLLLLYIVCFYHTPTAPITAAPCRYHAPVTITTVTSPYNTRYNTNWVLQCGDVHPNPGHRRIYQLRQGCRDVQGPPILLLDIEEYAQHLVVNTNRRYDSLDDAATAKDYDLTPITGRHELIPVRPPIMTYLGHVLAHPTQEDTAWDMVTTQLHHDVAAYRTLPLNAYEKVAIINAVLIPHWTYRGPFLGNRTRMAHWDDILLQFIRDTPGVEQQMNKHRLTTNLSHGRLGLRQLWWSYITRWITIDQQELQHTGPTQHLTATQYKYIDAVRALGDMVGQRISQPRQHRPLSVGLYDSESSEEDQEMHAGKTRPATNRLDYSLRNPPDEPTPEETHGVCQALPHQ